MGIRDRIQHAWNAFNQRQGDNGQFGQGMFGPVVSYNQGPSRTRLLISGERSILASIYTRIAIDCASVDVYHVRKDDKGRYVENMKSGLQECLTVEANIDQGATAFRQDIIMTMLENGHVAIVPVETTINPVASNSYDIKSLRVGTVVQWYPQHVRVSIYNEKVGRREEITLPKSMVAIAENPLYSVMNEPNSTYQRLVRKLNLLDVIDEQTSSGKLDIIIQLPYVVRTERQVKEAESRLQSIETQLKDSKYGIAYIDGTEHITQLNRPAENNLLKQVEILTDMLYDQLGITKDVLNGTASEETMTNYHQRTVRPIMTAIAESITRTFLTKTARAQGQGIQMFQDPFALVPVTKLAELADKFTRNEILTSNEFRGALAFPPSEDPRADMLLNKNLPTPDAYSGGDPSLGSEGGGYQQEYDTNTDTAQPDSAITLTRGKNWIRGFLS